MSGRFSYIVLATRFAIVPCVLAGTFEPPLPSGSPPHRKEWVWIQVADVEHYMLPIAADHNPEESTAKQPFTSCGRLTANELNLKGIPHEGTRY
jgi:hypothetical protein